MLRTLITTEALTLVLSMGLICPESAAAQAVLTTGTLSGTVTTVDGLPIPGASVVITAVNGSGQQTCSTNQNGSFIAVVSAGEYTVAVTAPGFKESRQNQLRITPASTTTFNAALETGATAEMVTVTGDATELLPITGRTVANTILLFAPFVTAGPNLGTVSIFGGPGYATRVVQNGTTVSDPVFGTINAFTIPETSSTVGLATAISDEYGRGGLTMYVVTRSGTNEFHGQQSFYVENKKWDRKPPGAAFINLARPLNSRVSAAAGGPLIRGRAFFFAAGQVERASVARQLPTSGIAYEQRLENWRGEGKLDVSFADSQRFTGYLSNGRQNEDDQQPFPSSAFLSTLIGSQQPRDRLSFRFFGGIGNNAAFQAGFGRTNIGFREAGGTDTNITKSPIFTNNFSVHVQNPGRNGRVDENRNIREITGRVNWIPKEGVSLWPNLGLGFERTVTTRSATNSLSPTGFLYSTDFRLNPDGGFSIDSSGQLVPHWVPDRSARFEFTQPGAQKFENRRATLGLSARWTPGDATIQTGVSLSRNTVVNNGTKAAEKTFFEPRLGLAFRLSDKTVIRGGYGIAYDPMPINLASGGNFRDAYNIQLYKGPVGEGLNFAPAFKPENFQTVLPVNTAQTVTIDPKLAPPSWRQGSLGIGYSMTRSDMALDIVWRQLQSAPEDRTLSGSPAQVTSGGVTALYDRQFWTTSRDVNREYLAVGARWQFQPSSRFGFGGTYTRQFKNKGNIQVDGPGLSSGFSPLDDYTTSYNPSQHAPVRPLAGFQRDRVRLWTMAELLRLPGTTVTGSAVFGAESGFAFPLTAVVAWTPEQTKQATAAGFVRPPISQTLFFRPNQTRTFQGQKFLDLAVTWDFRLGGIRPWIRVEAFNVFNGQSLTRFKTGIDPKGPQDTLGLPTTYVPSEGFGQAGSSSDYQTPLKFQFTLGLKFRTTRAARRHTRRIVTGPVWPSYARTQKDGSPAVAAMRRRQALTA